MSVMQRMTGKGQTEVALVSLLCFRIWMVALILIVSAHYLLRQ